ncbi:formate dehydrogenase, partial [Shigella flexneri]|nr:formate dehydrogenase [Shigella flexneri]EFY9795873.1 formate dehydrogenase [Shigella flexneri]EFY9824116.1 formate dehydrogenase [Shigella flexneri]EFZ8852075.1 formate dehydrogenase [Shigella flexneri]EGD8594664.1 formate dehydrogenase [Shigella flexneri]
ELRYLYSEYFADDTSLCQMKLTSFSITTFFQKQEIGYQEAGCYDMASCFLSEERF